MSLLQISNIFSETLLNNSIIVGFVTTLFSSWILVLTKRWHGFISMDYNYGIQKIHTSPTPRIGGIPIMIGMVFSLLFFESKEVKGLMLQLIIAGLPAFLFGLVEDLTQRVGVPLRLIATMASGLLAWYLSGYLITRVDVPGVDLLLQYFPVALIFTVFAVGGIANAINIIDGLNGLAGTMTALAFLGYALLAKQVGDETLAGVSLVIGACVVGFFCVNWPLGKIFLGDGGAYFLGFCLAWVAVMLLNRHPNVSSFAVLMVCIFPVIEVLFTIFRRVIRRDDASMPDRNHLHSLLARRYVKRWFRDTSSTNRNSITGVGVGMLTLVPIILANLTFENTIASILAILVMFMGYVAFYARIVRHAWSSPIKFLLVKPKFDAPTLLSRDGLHKSPN